LKLTILIPICAVSIWLRQNCSGRSSAHPTNLRTAPGKWVVWELQKFLVLALKANPNILECLYSPLVDKVTPLGEELLAMRECFLSQMIFQTFNGYAMSQFKKIEQDRRTRGEVRWKHVMHLLASS
jgi:predicted nucleotidyltransferase